MATDIDLSKNVVVVTDPQAGSPLTVFTQIALAGSNGWEQANYRSHREALEALGRIQESRGLVASARRELRIVTTDYRGPMGGDAAIQMALLAAKIPPSRTLIVSAWPQESLAAAQRARVKVALRMPPSSESVAPVFADALAQAEGEAMAEVWDSSLGSIENLQEWLGITPKR